MMTEKAEGHESSHDLLHRNILRILLLEVLDFHWRVRDI